MKKNCTVLVCFLVFALRHTIAQKPAAINASVSPALNFPTYRQDADTTLKRLDKTKIPTHILYDRIYPMAALQSYNNSITDTAAYSRFLQASAELKNASYNSMTMITSAQMKYYNDNASRGDTVRLGVLNFSFNLINPDADTNVVYNPLNYVVNSQYSFLLTKTVTIAAALAEVAYTTNGKVVFKWIDKNNLKNTTKTINYFNIDFNDGTSARTLQRNSSISITYPNKGNKYLKITTYFTDNTSSTNLAHIYVDGYGFSGTAARRVPDRNPDVPIRRFASEIAF